MMRYFLTLLTVLAISIPTLAQQYQYQQPQNTGDGWNTFDLKEMNIDTSRVYQLFNQLSSGNHKLHSMVIIKNNHLVLEEYFGEQRIDIQHDLRSATKSITAVLMGIAIDKGFIDDIDDPVKKYIKYPVPKKNQDQRKEEITIRHLLTMSTGLDCNDWDRNSKGQEDRVYKKKDWLQYFMDLPMLYDPGTVSSYCTMAQVLATEVIARASGMSVDCFAGQYLFNPMGITNVSWGHTSGDEVIPSAKRLYMTSRDMAKIGQLVLNRGKWNGEQLVSEKWVETATAIHTDIAGMEYGFYWWQIPFKTDETVYNLKAATGNGGQYIIVVPELDLVAVFTGGAYNSEEDKLPFAIIRDIILPTFANAK